MIRLGVMVSSDQECTIPPADDLLQHKASLKLVHEVLSMEATKTLAASKLKGLDASACANLCEAMKQPAAEDQAKRKSDKDANDAMKQDGSGVAAVPSEQSEACKAETEHDKKEKKHKKCNKRTER